MAPYLHVLMRPYDSVDVRGIPVKRLIRAYHLATGRELDFRTRTGIIEGLMPDPTGTVTVVVPPEVVDDHATVLALEFAAGPV